jgi:pimeloyl-ACP methyl ester carboxylesterase
MTRFGRVPLFVLCATLLAQSACFAPIRVKRVDAARVHRALTENELTRGAISRETRNLLYNYDLTEQYKKDPAGALRELHAAYLAGKMLPEERAALAELAFHHADNGGGRPYFLLSAVYAWAYLFPDDLKDLPSRFSPRVRLACDLYNRGLTEALKNGKNVELRSGTYSTPVGTMEVSLDPDALRWGDHELVNLVPIAELQVEGFPTYYRWTGIGAPLAAGVKPIPSSTDVDLLARRVRVPVTVLARFSDLDAQLRAGAVRAKLEVYPGYGDRTVTIAGRDVPLEAEPTAAMALTLSETDIWAQELTGFLRSGLIDKKTRLVSTRPYEPGLIPVVFVHGTASSAARWAQMYNELDNDPRIHKHFQFWFFSYETGNPIAYSAMLLRDALTGAAAKLDPEGRDEALRHMVVIGHSQGGLLTKATVVESGNRFWDNISKKPLDELRMSDSTRELLRKALFFHPVPEVRRVVFLATPHHGSYVAGSWVAHQLARLVRAPFDLTKGFGEALTGNRDALILKENEARIPTSVDNMTPGNRFVRTLVTIPVTAGVTAHSIIPISDGVIAPGAGDGVVKYESAHIDGVESELVVRSGHSCQDNPHTIGEVRRILLEHLEQEPVGPAVVTPATTPEKIEQPPTKRKRVLRRRLAPAGAPAGRP